MNRRKNDTFDRFSFLIVCGLVVVFVFSSLLIGLIISLCLLVMLMLFWGLGESIIPALDDLNNWGKAPKGKRMATVTVVIISLIAIIFAAMRIGCIDLHN